MPAVSALDLATNYQDHGGSEWRKSNLSYLHRIRLIRGEKVIIDSDLAEFYGVPTKRLNEQAKRNISRFPDDFMLQLSSEEKLEVVANCDHLKKLKYSRFLPYAFTEHGSIMAAGVLNTPRAIEVSVYIVPCICQHAENDFRPKGVAAENITD